MEPVPDRATDTSATSSDDAADSRSAGRSGAGEPPKAVLSRVRDFRTAVRQLLDEPSRLRAEVLERHAELRAGAVAQQLQAMPLERLRAGAAAGLRLGNLEKAGLRTVHDAVNADPTSLQEHDGIGVKTAKEAVRAARKIADAAERETGVRLDPDDRGDPVQEKLLRALRALRVANDAVAIPELEGLLSRADDVAQRASRTGNRFRMFLSRRAKRNDALAALGEAELLLGDGRVGTVENGIQRISRAEIDDRAWRDYEKRAAEYNTLLNEIVGTGAAEDESSRGFLPDDARREVDATTLDTSWLRVTLRGYQDFGAKFALVRKRCILGDEMGLGKTIQALSAMAHLRANGRTHFLVVCPASIMINWVNEIGKHSGLVPHLLHGPEREAAMQQWSAVGGVGVTTYRTLSALPDIEQTRVDMLVADEAHLVKNPNAQRSQAIAAVGERVEHVLFLTGTPMENRVSEFKELVAHLQPGVAERIGSNDALMGAREFRRIVAAVYLRRNGEDVLTELPDRLGGDQWVQLTSRDAELYREAVETGNLMKIRAAAFTAGTSAKMQRIREIVEEAAANGWKVVVFSFFRAVLDTVRTELGPPVVGVLNGSLTPAARQELIDDFGAVDGHAVLVSQVESGGLGLNLQAASIVILTEPQFKPSTEDQAIARCHRMGQARKVHVHRLMAADTVDQRMREILEQKSRLFDAYARESDAKMSDAAATDGGEVNEQLLFDESVPMEQRLVEVERQRLRDAD